MKILNKKYNSMQDLKLGVLEEVKKKEFRINFLKKYTTISKQAEEDCDIGWDMVEGEFNMDVAYEIGYYLGFINKIIKNIKLSKVDIYSNILSKCQNFKSEDFSSLILEEVKYWNIVLSLRLYDILMIEKLTEKWGKIGGQSRKLIFVLLITNILKYGIEIINELVKLSGKWSNKDNAPYFYGQWDKVEYYDLERDIKFLLASGGVAKRRQRLKRWKNAFI